MSPEAAKFLKRLESEQDSLEVRRLRSLLETPEAYFEPPSRLVALAGDLEPTYRIRYQIAKRDKNTRRLIGLSSLVSALQASSPSRRIVHRSVVGEWELGEIFLDADTDEIVGIVVITMSVHTRAYYRGELKGDPSAARPNVLTPARDAYRRAAKRKKIMA